MSSEGPFILELSGADLSLDSVDPLEVLGFASSYLELLRRTAKEYRIPVSFTGMRLEPGSARLVTRASDTEAADLAQRHASQFITGARPCPPSLRAPVEEARRVLRSLPEGHVATVVSLGSRVVLQPGKHAGLPPQGITTLRADLVSIGGKATPKARFSSRFERNGEVFGVELSVDVARQMAAHLYTELEIVVRVQRDEDGRIVGGRLLEYKPVDNGNGLEAWRKWYAENARQWDDVVDIEEELGRDGP